MPPNRGPFVAHRLEDRADPGVGVTGQEMSDQNVQPPPTGAPGWCWMLGRAPNPAKAARLTLSQVVSALQAARRHHVQDKVRAHRCWRISP